MSLDRSIAPPLQAIEKLQIHPPETLTLANNSTLHLINQGAQDLLMLNLSFNAGKWYEPQKHLAQFTNRMLREGTLHLNSQQIAQQTDYYGASLRTQSRNNHAEVILYTLSKHLKDLLPIIKSLVTQAIFPAKELDLILQNSKEKLLVNQQKTDYVADGLFRQLMFGNTHPYGYDTYLSDFDTISIDKLIPFYQKHYCSSNCSIYLAGKISDTNLAIIREQLGGSDWLGSSVASPSHPIPLYEVQHKRHRLPGALQAAIRVGMPFMTRRHPDYAKVFIVNTLLGGFFGSRLMRNIREDKGYTYGIYSNIASMVNGGYFLISSEVDTNSWEACLKEIFFEINRLKTDLISDEELHLVRNYLLGTLLSYFDGPFNLASAVQGVYPLGLDLNFYHNLISTIQHISAQEIRDCAEQYFDTRLLSTLVVY